MLGGADNPNGELPSYITGADSFFEEFIFHRFLAEQALEFFNLLHGGSKFQRQEQPVLRRPQQ
ncbi:Uncharacterised protein [Escherichia coli]|uniref:Uncharacterized protein n=1 Tax=Escherichia coli TaxID=562 RepID=A0A376NRY5_ECOLX|nr:Uncharacterised protein [Escherichia coli]